MNEAVDNPSIHWLDPVTSFEPDNTLDSQLDFPITPKTFLFHYFDVVANTSNLNVNVDKSLMDFYLKHGKPQF